jgi:hypothetical protein
MLKSTNTIWVTKTLFNQREAQNILKILPYIRIIIQPQGTSNYPYKFVQSLYRPGHALVKSGIFGSHYF